MYILPVPKLLQVRWRHICEHFSARAGVNRASDPPCPLAVLCLLDVLPCHILILKERWNGGLRGGKKLVKISFVREVLTTGYPGTVASVTMRSTACFLHRPSPSPRPRFSQCMSVIFIVMQLVHSIPAMLCISSQNGVAGLCAF